MLLRLTLLDDSQVLIVQNKFLIKELSFEAPQSKFPSLADFKNFCYETLSFDKRSLSGDILNLHLNGGVSNVIFDFMNSFELESVTIRVMDDQMNYKFYSVTKKYSTLEIKEERWSLLDFNSSLESCFNTIQENLKKKLLLSTSKAEVFYNEEKSSFVVKNSVAELYTQLRYQITRE